MRIFKHRLFHQWAEAENLGDDTLKRAVEEMGRGLYEANLGGGLYKKRLAMPGKGKRGGYRTLIAFKHDERAFFVYGFAKNKRANINEHEKKIYRQLAKDFINMNESAIQTMLEQGRLWEVK